MPELWYTIIYGVPAPLILRTQDFAKGCEDIVGKGRGNITTAAVAGLTQIVVWQPEEPNFVGFWGRLGPGGLLQSNDRQPSILATSTSIIGISSWIG